MSDQFEFRVIEPQLCRQVAEISAEVGWNQSGDELATVMSRRNETFVGAFADDLLVGCAAACRYENAGFAFIHEVIVRRDWRMRGIATALLNRLIPMTVPTCPTLRLYATATGRPIYEKLGFAPYGTVCFCKTTAWACDTPTDIRRATRNDMAAMCDLDERNFGARREFLIRELFEDAPGDAWCLTNGDGLAGFVLRGPMCWLAQCERPADIGRLAGHAGRNDDGERVICLWKEDVDSLGWGERVELEITAMQRGDGLPTPVKSHSGCLPDIG